MTMSAAESVASPMARQIGLEVSTSLQRIRRWYRRRQDLREARAAFMHIVYLDDQILDDMGVTREEVCWATSLPLEENAALALRERAAKRRRSSALAISRLAKPDLHSRQRSSFDRT